LTRSDEPNPSWLDLPDLEEPPWVAPNRGAGGEEPERVDSDALGLPPSALPGPSEDRAGDLGGHGLGDTVADDAGPLDDRSLPTVADLERTTGPGETIVAPCEPARDPGATVDILRSMADARSPVEPTPEGVADSTGAGAHGGGHETVTEAGSPG